MASANNLTAQAHLAAGMQKLEALRRQFAIYLERKEQKVLARAATGQGDQAASPGSIGMSEWLN